jgi:hypothetical protein
VSEAQWFVPQRYFTAFRVYLNEFRMGWGDPTFWHHNTSFFSGQALVWHRYRVDLLNKRQFYVAVYRWDAKIPLSDFSFPVRESNPDLARTINDTFGRMTGTYKPIY